MPIQIKLTELQIQDFQVIRDLKVGALASIAMHFSSLMTAPLKPSKLQAAIKELLGEDEQAAESILRQTLTLNGIMRQSGMDVDTVLAGIKFGIKRESKWSAEEIAAWNEVTPAFRDLICTRAFRLAARAIDLSYEYANLFLSGRILTDIRPLFTEKADGIEGAVVSYTLRILFESADGRHELSIAMDENDIQKLSEECDRAIKKGRTARDVMGEGANIPVIISGEREDD